MKKSLLLFLASVMVMGASAQLSRHAVRSVQQQPLNTLQSRPQAKMEVMQMREPGTSVVKSQRKAAPPTSISYRRPAGAFNCNLVVKDGSYAGMPFTPILAVKPYTYYTFNSMVEGAGPDVTYEWDVQTFDSNENEYEWMTVTGEDLTFKWGVGVYEAPIFYVMDGDDYYTWSLHGYEMGGTPDNPTVVNEHKGYIHSLPSTMYFWEEDWLKSSKAFIYGGRNGDCYYPMTYYSGGIVPFGDNAKGWWFGKNGGTPDKRCRIDGIAQAFEKPTAPYRLNQVVMDCAFLEVAGEAEMTCKIYRLDGIPPYSETDVVVLPDDPGELIAKGRARINSETYENTGGLVFFELYGEEDGLEYDNTPTIDFPILVAIDGYNDPGMEKLVNFSALISSDIHSDEGFGELAYLKRGVNDEEGNLDHYEWVGLNNFFKTGEMKTGLTIFLSTELPYLTFNVEEEDGEYVFPDEGGLMEKHFGDYTTSSIEFWSWEPSADGNWWMSCNGDDVPEWLTIELEDQMEYGEFTGVVNATVTADPLPAGVNYREAVVRFEYSGAYQDYKFIQGYGGWIVPPDPDWPNIAMVNWIIGIILGDNVPADERRWADVNDDGTINISDVNAVIHLILY